MTTRTGGTDRAGKPRLFREVDGHWAFVPSSPAQNDFLVSMAPDLLFTGGWGLGGKSIALCVKMSLLGLRYAGAPMVLGRKVHADLKTSTLPILERVISEMLGAAAWERGVRGGSNPERFEFANGSAFDFVGFDRREKLLSTEYAFIGIDECNELNKGDWEFAAGRLRSWAAPFRQIMGACNPDSPAHFLYPKFQPNLGSHRIYGDERECEACRGTGKVQVWMIDDDSGRTWSERSRCDRCEGRGRARDVVAEVVVAGATENAENLPPEYRARLARLTGVYKRRYADGQWVAYEGTIYPNFDPWFHVIDRPEEWTKWGGYPPPGWPRYRGIDFGYVNPFVCLWLTAAPDGTFYVYRELYHTRRTVRQHASQIRGAEKEELETLRARCAAMKLPLPDGLRIRLSAADHDAEGVATLSESGVETEHAIKEREIGIQTVYQLIQPYEIESGVRRAKLYFVKDALMEVDGELEPAGKPKQTFEEIPVYRYRPAPKEGSIRGQSEEPQDQNDHGCDALRYALHTLHVQGETRVRVIGAGVGGEDDD